MQAKQDLTVTLAIHTFEEKEEQIQYDIDASGVRFVKNDSPKRSDEGSQEGVLEEDSKAATGDEIQVVKAKLRDVQVNIKQLQSEAKLSVMRQNGHNDDLLENQDWNFYFMLIEVACFFCIVAYQTHHIKKILDNKLFI